MLGICEGVTHVIQEVSVAKGIRHPPSLQELVETRRTEELVEDATGLIGCHISFSEPVQNGSPRRN